MRIIITGATGFIGQALCRALHSDFEIVALSRDGSKAAALLQGLAATLEWDGRTTSTWTKAADGAFAIINLAGEDLASGKWTHSKRNWIQQSRLSAVKAVADAVAQARTKPNVVIQASAVGYYGSRADEELHEDSPPGDGFLAEVCRRTEAVAEKINGLGSRCVAIRMGMVLGRDGGVLPRLMRPFRLFLGGTIGSGSQWVSWISLHDLARAVRFLIDRDSLQGPFNLTSPNPVTMRQLCKTLGRTMQLPCWTRLPDFAVRWRYGEMARETILASQKVLPRRLKDAGFGFEHAELPVALAATLEPDTDQSV